MVIDLNGSSPESLSAARGNGPAAISPSDEEVVYVPPAAAASAVGVHPSGPRNDDAAPGAGDEGEDPDPLCHHAQMVLLLDSQRRDSDFVNATVMRQMYNQIVGNGELILKTAKESNFAAWKHNDIKQVLDTPISIYTAGPQRVGKHHYARWLVAFWNAI